MSSLAPAVGPSLPAVAVDAPRTAGEAIIWLSVLVPAFNQPAGIVRILRSLASVRGRGDIEILVSDDSTDDGAASRLAALCAAFDTAHYVRNKPALGAVPNWNALLDRARGRYCLLLHHDEEIEGTASMPALIDALKVPDAPDAWILPCCVVDRPGALPRLHFPARLAAIAACRFPAYLMRRNLIGPPSALIVRREKYLHFDTRLHWLVDVEGYYRTLRRARTVRAWKGGGVISHRDAENSITATLGPRMAEIKAADWQALSDKYSGKPGLCWLFSRTPLAHCLRVAESVLWVAFRSVYRLRQVAAGAFGVGRR